MTKWCRCDEPSQQYNLRHSNALRLSGWDPVTMGVKSDISQGCRDCNKPWRKWRNIRGTELIDYPIGTEFLCNSRCLTKFMKVKIRLSRCPDDALIIQYYEDFWRSLPLVDYGFYMLQDRFEIVGEQDA